jgi:hypothetical protein
VTQAKENFGVTISLNRLLSFSLSTVAKGDSEAIGFLLLISSAPLDRWLTGCWRGRETVRSVCDVYTSS